MKKFPYCVPQTTNPHTAVPCYIYLWGRSCCVDFQLHFVAKTSSNLNVERCCHILSTLAQPCTMTQARWLYVELMQIKSLAINVLLLMHFPKPPGGGWRLLFLLTLSSPPPTHTHSLHCWQTSVTVKTLSRTVVLVTLPQTRVQTCLLELQFPWSLAAALTFCQAAHQGFSTACLRNWYENDWATPKFRI